MTCILDLLLEGREQLLLEDGATPLALASDTICTGFSEIGHRRNGAQSQLTSDQILPTHSFETEELGTYSSFTHNHFGVRFFDPNNNPVVMTAGTLDMSVKTIESGTWEDYPSPAILATSPCTRRFVGGLLAIKVTPSGLAGPAFSHYRVYLSRYQN